jgi:drug/metabolite transporter (DMT)-like permease
VSPAERGVSLESPREVRRAHIAMIAMAMLVATSFSFGSLLANIIAPVPLTFARFVFATLVFVVVVLVTRTKVRLDGGLVYRGTVLGLIYVTYFVTMFIALKTVSPLSTGAVFALVPLLAALIGWLIGGRKLSGRSLALLILAGLGAVWVVFDGSLDKLLGFQAGYGEVIYFSGCVLYAAYPTFLQKTARGDAPQLLTLVSFVAAMLLLLVWDASSIVATDWLALSVWQWSVLLWMAVVPTAITFFLLQYASLRLPPAKVMAYTYLTPACIIPLEVMLGHGLPTISIIAGICVIIAALAAFEMS